MTKDDIIKMAQIAGWDMGSDLSDGFGERLQRFASLVEQETLTNQKVWYYKEGMRDEREECAKLVEQMGIDGYGTLAAAAMIRKRGER